MLSVFIILLQHHCKTKTLFLMKNNYTSVLFLTITFLYFNISSSSAQGSWKNILKDYQFTDLVFTDEYVWVSTDSVGLEIYCYGGDFYDKKNTEDGLPSNKVRAIEKDENDKIWIGTDEGIAYSEGKNWVNVNENNSNLFSNDVKDIKLTASGNVWIGFDHAIQSWNPQSDTWELFDASNVSFFPDSTFINLEVDGDDVVWAAFPHNLIKFSEPIEKYTLPPKYHTYVLSNNTIKYDTIYSEIRFISKDSDGKIRAVNGYDSYINELNNTINWGYGRDITGVIYEFSRRDYWWGGGNRISNAKYYESTDISCNNPDMIFYYKNDSMSFGGLGLRKAPLRFSPTRKLWIIHHYGISILHGGYSSELCKKKEIVKLQAFTFPNPSNGLLNLNLPERLYGKINVTVHNSNGQLFWEKDIYQNLEELDLTHLKYGIYFLKFTHQDWTHVEKISIF